MLGIVLVLAAYGVTLVVFNRMSSHRVEKFAYEPGQLGLAAETVSLTSEDGTALKGWYAAVRPARAIVVVLHGMDGLDASSLLPHARFLNDAGYSAFLLDMRAHGRSGGTRIGWAYTEPRDVEAVLDWIAVRPEARGVPVVLLGLSMGGATAIRTAAMRTDVAAVISVSAFADVERFFGRGAQLLLGRLAVLTLYGVWAPRNSPVHDIPRISPRPVLIIHGTADRQVPVENALQLRRAGGPNVETWIVEGADHLVFTETGNGAGEMDRAYRAHVLAFLERLSQRARSASRFRAPVFRAFAG